MSAIWNGRRVFVTGHTGFKGGWLCLTLSQLGAKVFGYSLPPPTQPNLYTDAAIGDKLDSFMGDIRDFAFLKECLMRSRAEVVFHLAAQSLVRRSYADPLETYSTNVIGTANLLEACRDLDSVRAILVVSTDKCYLNREWVWGYREDDALGGYDPYSSSKAATELLTASYRQSFFNPESYLQHQVALASARAGNVIGGGDWADDRLIPDSVRAFSKRQVVPIRNPHAKRPWQHVLEPVRGYMTLVEKLLVEGPAFSEAWNFGPTSGDLSSVGNVMDYLCQLWQDGAKWQADGLQHPHEAQHLKLDCSKAAERLLWRPWLSLGDGLKLTAQWYKTWVDRRDVAALTRQQIKDYFSNPMNGSSHD